MLTVHVLRGLVGTHDREHFRIPHVPGETVRQLSERFRQPEWSDLKLAACRLGGKLSEEQLDEQVPDGDEIVIAPEIGLPAVPLLVQWIFIVLAAASIAYSVYQMTVGRPKAKGGQDRGDQTSATFAFDGIQTQYGQGYSIPAGYGRHDLGGQVLGMSINVEGETEILGVLLAFGEGRWESIGGITGGVRGEKDRMGGFVFPENGLLPADIRVNDVRLDHTNVTPGALASIRMGEVDQTPINNAGPTGLIVLVGQDLNDLDSSAIGTITDTNQLLAISVIIAFPQGLLKQNTNGTVSPDSVQFELAWRSVGGASWNVFPTFTVAPASPKYSAFSYQHRVAVNMVGPVEVRLKRLTPSAPSVSQTQAYWRQLTYNLLGGFSYPRMVLLELELRTTERLSGGNPQFRANAKMRRVHVYGVAGEAVSGLSALEYWDVPPAGDPFLNIWTHPPGQNPAWIAVQHMLDTWTLGNYLGATGIDFDAFRDFADYCDDTIDGLARYSFNYVFDKPTRGWETLQRICQVGRAMPYIKGNLVSVYYQYADAHGKGSNVVPARARTQLFTSANIEEFGVYSLKSNNRPTVLFVEFKDEDREYADVREPVEDPDAETQPHKLGADLLRTETLDLRGCTRKGMAIRHGLFMHRQSRLVQWGCSLKVGPEALASTLGDVIGIQSDYIRPYDKESFSGRITSATATAVSAVTVDRALLIVPADSPRFMVKQPDESIIEVGVTNGAGVLAAGGTLTLAAPITFKRGAAFAFGALNKTVKDFQVVNVTLSKDLRHELTCIEWVPAVHDEPATLPSEAVPPFMAAEPEMLSELAREVSTLAVRRLPQPGTYVIGWEVDATQPQRRVIVFARLAGESAWWRVGESTTGEIITTAFDAAQRYELVAQTASKAGDMPPLGGRVDLEFIADEFPAIPPQDVGGIVVAALAQGVLVAWDAVEGEGFEYYEIRRGDHWVGAECIYRGPEPWFFYREPPAGNLSFLVRARSPNGLYSQRYEPATLTWTGSNGTAVVGALTLNELATTPGGVLSNITYDAATDTLTLADGEHEGSYVGPILDAGSVASRVWSTLLTVHQVDADDVEDMDFDVGSGEAMWRTTLAREPSPGRPASNLRTDVSTMLLDIADLPADLHARGRSGQVGQRVLALLEVDYDVTGAGGWTGYRPHKVEQMVAQKQRIRLTLRRESLTTNVVVTDLVRAGYA